MATILARKVQNEIPVATDDEAHAKLIDDPTMPQFPPSVPLTSNSTYNVASGADILVKADEHWINRRWRPAMGWLYMATCLFDFILFPILWSILQALTKGSVTTQWQPLTLQGAGLYHIAMGAVLGIAAYGRTQEKISGNN